MACRRNSHHESAWTGATRARVQLARGAERSSKMRIAAYHAKYFAHELTRRYASDDVEKLAAVLADAQVDLNPHQVEAVLFAFRSPFSKGAILADEVGLGKTIEAGLLLSEKWVERKRRLLVIVPANLRKQWAQELSDFRRSRVARSSYRRRSPPFLMKASHAVARPCWKNRPPATTAGPTLRWTSLTAGPKTAASLKAELTELDEALKDAKKAARLAPTLPERLERQRAIRTLEDK